MSSPQSNTSTSSSSTQNVPNGDLTTTALLMRCVGTTLSVTGYAFSAVAILYFVKFFSIFGCATIELLPTLFAGNTVKVAEHYNLHQVGNIYAYGCIAACIFSGIFMRKLGIFITSDKTINTMENIIARTQHFSLRKTFSSGSRNHSDQYNDSHSD
jgi:hypothetical protein